MSKQNFLAKESGKTVIYVLAGLVVIAIGITIFMANRSGEITESVASQAEPASGENITETAKTTEIKEGNPVVAKVGDEEITRSEVLGFIQQLPENVRQQPLNQLFPAAQEQLINSQVIDTKVSKINLDKDPDVVKQLETAKKEIVRNTYVQRQVSEKATDDRLKKAYETYKQNYPKVEERRASHILVDNEDKAKEILAKVKKGEDFAELAKENSKDATATNGGDLGFFAKSDVVPAFAEAVYSTAPGKLVEEPVKTQFGFHVVKVEEERTRPVPEFDAVKPLLDVQVRRAALDELIQKWKDDADIERFDINGDPIEPAAGE